MVDKMSDFNKIAIVCVFLWLVVFILDWIEVF